MGKKKYPFSPQDVKRIVWRMFEKMNRDPGRTPGWLKGMGLGNVDFLYHKGELRWGRPMSKWDLEAILGDVFDVYLDSAVDLIPKEAGHHER